MTDEKRTTENRGQDVLTLLIQKNMRQRLPKKKPRKSCHTQTGIKISTKLAQWGLNSLKQSNKYLAPEDIMNRKEILNELMKRYSFEKAHSIRQIATEDREFENDDVYIMMTRTLDGDIFDCKWKK